jgi:hypothetical protein
MDRNKLPLKSHHLGVPSGASKPISEPMVRLAQTLHLSCSDANTISEWTKTRVLTGASKTISSPMVCSAQTVTERPLEPQVRPKRLLSLWYVWRNPYTYVAPTLTPSPNRPKQYSTWSTSPRSSISASKMISEPMIRSVQIVHLSCIKISTISKQTETSIHLSLITLEFKLFYPKWFLNLWYILPKQCTYLAPTLTPSPNRLKQDSSWSMSPRSFIMCVQNDFRAYGTFSAYRAPILCQD